MSYFDFLTFLFDLFTFLRLQNSKENSYKKEREHYNCISFSHILEEKASFPTINNYIC